MMQLLHFFNAYARSSHSSQGHYSHGKTLLSADDSTSNLIEKIKFIQSDCPELPQAYLHVWTSTKKFICSIWVPFLCLSLLPLAIGWDTVGHLHLDSLTLDLRELFFSSFSPQLTALSGLSFSSLPFLNAGIPKDLSLVLCPLAISTLQLLAGSSDSRLPLLPPLYSALTQDHSSMPNCRLDVSMWIG